MDSLHLLRNNFPFWMVNQVQNGRKNAKLLLNKYFVYYRLTDPRLEGLLEAMLGPGKKAATHPGVCFCPSCRVEGQVGEPREGSPSR